MRIPLPDRLAPRSVGIFVSLLFIGQMLCGTDVVFALLTAIYVVLWAAGVNVTGGMSYPSGAYIFFTGILTAIVGLTFKVFLLQPGERNLIDPRSTMIAYCMGMGAMVIAASMSSALRTKEPLLKGFASMDEMKDATVACFVLSIATTFLLGSNQSASGSFITAFRQINRYAPMSVMLATVYQIRRTNGKSSLNWVGIASISYLFFFGLIYSTKEGMLLGPTAWFLAAAMMNFRFTKTQLVSAALGMAFMVYYLVPYSQYVRGFTTTSKTENVAIAIKYLSNLEQTRLAYNEILANIDISQEGHLFDERVPLMDRTVQLPPDDQIISFTNKGNVYGLQPTYAAWANVVPHFIWPNKPSVGTGNLFAHEMGGLAEDDSTTGISFSAFGEAYHQAKWLGLLLVLPFDMFIAFIIMDSLVGSARRSPWPLLWVLEASHVAPEGGLGGPVYFATYGVIAMLFLVWSLKTAVPFLLNTFGRNSRPNRRPGGAQAALAFPTQPQI